ncbi:hypothetical protein IFM89_001691 [Coptis chinensis]|uniref:DBP10 C-terminal domain-containing protein n=1 Tax=Coptis chinensis TaxID=261450 RepID=A0A835HI75_9MAGN|nr:hypothetical protein IFM89_001691 [Coptis chinensis]
MLTLLPREENAVSAIIKGGSVAFLRLDPQKHLEPKVQILRDLGVPDSSISKLILIGHRACSQGNDNFSDTVKEVLEMGFDPSSKMFVYAVREVSGVCKAKREVKMGIFRSFGWSDEEIRLAIRNQPMCITISEEKLRIGLDFFMNGKNWEAERLAKYPNVLSLSLYKRIIPRLNVIEFLISKSLLEKDGKLASALYLTDAYFIKKYVAKYEDRAPGLLKLYQGLSVRGNEGFGSSRLDAAVLDLVAYDSTGLQKQKSDYHWDKKRKRYIKLNDNDRVTASGKWKMKVFRWDFAVIVSLFFGSAFGFNYFIWIQTFGVKTESGSKVKSTKTGIYKRWKERSHHKVSLRGTDSDGGHSEVDRGFSGDRQMQGDNRNYSGGRSEEDRGFSGNCQMRGDNRNYRGGSSEGDRGFSGDRQMRGGNRNYKGGKKHGIPNAHVPSEIKNPDQVRKRRQQQASKISYMKSKPGKGKKFGKNGKKGKNDTVKEVLEMGFDPSSKMFVYAVREVSGVCKAKREVKKGIFISFGWSDEEIRLAIRNQPMCITISEEKLRIGLDFFMNGKNWEAERLAKYPNVLSLSLYKRIIPRLNVIEFLISKSLLEKDGKLASALYLTDANFIKKYVAKYEDRAPELLKLYQGQFRSI